MTTLMLMIRFSIEKFVIESHPWSMTYIRHYIDAFVIGVTVLVVAIPEGLPLAVTLSLAYSVRVSPFLSPVSIQTQSLALCALRKRKPQARNKRKRQPIGMLGRSSGNHDWLLVNASACVSCGFRLRFRSHATQAIAFEWKPGLRMDSL